MSTDKRPEREPVVLVGYDVPLPNGCFKCIGCGVILPKGRNWNQCSECDTREWWEM